MTDRQTAKCNMPHAQHANSPISHLDRTRYSTCINGRLWHGSMLPAACIIQHLVLLLSAAIMPATVTGSPARVRQYT